MVLNSDSKIEGSGNPTEKAMLVLADKFGININNHRSLNPTVYSIPFSSVNKRMTKVT
jgi:magnesium-transporting ATPase (P-type)